MIPERQETPRISNFQNPITPLRGLKDEQNTAFGGRTNEIGFKDKTDIHRSAIQICRSFSPFVQYIVIDTPPILSWRWGSCATIWDAMRFFRVVT